MTPRQITIMVFLIGLGIFIYSLTLPYYHDLKAADELMANSLEVHKFFGFAPHHSSSYSHHLKYL